MSLIRANRAIIPIGTASRPLVVPKIHQGPTNYVSKEERLNRLEAFLRNNKMKQNRE